MLPKAARDAPELLRVLCYVLSVDVIRVFHDEPFHLLLQRRDFFRG